MTDTTKTLHDYRTVELAERMPDANNAGLKPELAVAIAEKLVAYIGLLARAHDLIGANTETLSWRQSRDRFESDLHAQFDRDGLSL